MEVRTWSIKLRWRLAQRLTDLERLIFRVRQRLIDPEIKLIWRALDLRQFDIADELITVLEKKLGKVDSNVIMLKVELSSRRS